MTAKTTARNVKTYETRKLIACSLRMALERGVPATFRENRPQFLRYGARKCENFSHPQPGAQQ